MYPHLRLPIRRALLALLAAVTLAPLLAVSVAGPVSAAPSNNRAYRGFPDVTTNGFGGGDSWGGSFGLYTGHDQTGEFFAAYCIERGVNYPQGTDPNFADANSGFDIVADLPASRGVPAETRSALSYALWKYGSTTDNTTAGAMFIVTHVLSGDPTFGSSTVSGTTLGSGWPDPAAVHARAVQIEQEAYAKRGPWSLSTTLNHVSGTQFNAVVTLTGPGGAIAGEQVAVSVSNGSGSATYTTNSSGQITLPVTVTNPANPVTVTASKNQVPAGQNYRVFRGRPGTQTVITSGGNGSGITSSATGQVPNGTLNANKTTTNPAYQSGQGAVFQIREGTPTGTIVGTVTVGANGTAPALTLDPGLYYLIETSAPEGQVLDSTPRQFTVTAGETVNVPVTNQVIASGELTLTKLDEVTGEPLAGAVLLVERDSNNDGTFDTLIGDGPDGIPGTADDGQWVTELTPVTVDELLVGRYRVTEIVPPPGYTLPENATQTVLLTYGSHSTPDDNVLSVDVTFEDLVPVISTEAQDQVVEYGDEVRDIVTVDNVASTTTGQITVSLYGPFTSEDSMVCDASTLAGSVTYTATGSGTTTSPPLIPDESGIYTFVATWAGEDGSTATHPCGIASETLRVNPHLATHVTEDHVGVSDELIDVAVLTGVPPTTSGTITAELFGPFDRVEDIVCDTSTLVLSVEYPATGSGEHPSPPVTVDRYGIYTFVETWNGEDGTTATHECGLVTETITVDPEIATQVSSNEISDGDTVTDIAVLTGVPAGEEGTITVDLYGPFGSSDDITCTTDTLFATGEVPTIGSGTFESDEFIVPPGIYTFVETWESSRDETWRATHECGLTTETFVNKPRTPLVWTGAKVSNDPTNREAVHGAVYHLYVNESTVPATYLNCGIFGDGVTANPYTTADNTDNNINDDTDENFSAAIALPDTDTGETVDEGDEAEDTDPGDVPGDEMGPCPLWALAHHETYVNAVEAGMTEDAGDAVRDDVVRPEANSLSERPAEIEVVAVPDGYQLLAEVVTDEAGLMTAAVWSGGEYCLREVEAPNGFDLSQEVVCFDDPENVTEVKDDRTSLQLKATKVNVEDVTETIAGGTYEVYARNNEAGGVQVLAEGWFPDAPEGALTGNDLVYFTSITTGADGTASFNIPAGFSWCFREVDAPSGWHLDTELRCTDVILTAADAQAGILLPQSPIRELPRTGWAPSTLIDVAVILLATGGAVRWHTGTIRRR